MAMRILISDKMSSEGLANFEGHADFETVYKPDITMDALAEEIGQYDALVIRSRTRVTRETLARPGKLKIIGRAGAGVDNVDIDAATERGIIVMNTPGANTISTAEHTIAMMMTLARRTAYADRTMKEGQWAKKDIVGVELSGKTLGVIGLGKIGRVVAERMRAFEMRVLTFDPFLTHDQAHKLGIEPADVDTICREADFITIHCPLNNETRNLINAERLALMKPTALLINCARGGIVNEDDLYEALAAGRIAGAALDVFTQEPLPADHKLRTLPNIVLTPHLAASTNEAQEKVSRDIAVQIREALAGGVVRNAVNAPTVDPKTYEAIGPAMDLCLRIGRFCSQYAQAPVKELDITYSGAKAKHPPTPLTTELVRGFLQYSFSEPVNAVNALHIARQLGIRIIETRIDESDDVYAGLVTVRTTDEKGEVNTLSGALNHARQPRFVIFNEKRIDAIPEGHMLIIENVDVPGIIGSVGTCLGEHKINIASMNWGRVAPGGDALTVINTDQPIPNHVLECLRALPNVLGARHVVI
ncbi:MAG TPA: phosphoglycerate dehydrogenase [Candidatus Sumerlaeota bacterium]|nr:phosphoglycerate dehydrogenase [Candidatus Sumerlaeota bacterium]HOR28326.1 phosphoglycerate dehydrogenase [Candidatus Sumerlaeota bacterium]HPK00898.1 phosphoglycerate dehydrogenase [Candidatus Sumerlaeota bacterium]